jgi:hypothetical protein
MMAREVRDVQVPIVYSDKTREYALRLYDDEGETLVIDCIDYCPWCGRALPAPLRDEWFALLRERVPTIEPFDDELPEEFRDGTWWRSRNL